MDIKLKDVIISANTGADAIQRAPIVEYDTGVKCLRIGDISNNREYVDWGYTKINEDNYKRYKLRKGNIIIARTGSTVGINKYIENDYNSVYNNGLIRLVIDETNYDSKFIYYMIQMRRFRDYINGIAFGTTGQPNIQINDLLNFKFNYISLERQHKIANILSKIDKKIELNNQINDNLYKLGDILYKEFYSKYENNLPEGYKYFNLNEVSVNYDSNRKPMSSRERERHKGIYPYYGATSIIDYVDDYIFDDTYLLIGEDGTVKTTEGYPVLQYIWGKNWINNHAHVLQGTIISTEHLMFALRKKNIEALITGAVQPKINQVNMNKIKIIIGTDEVNKKFEEQIKVIVAKIKANFIENDTLTKLRDTLLPRLMNGEIDLDKIEI
ncbi:MAG: restriction endonuclease subunit S [Clostridia bacterium]|nr:restriction endonuclease subunit S [Clostridia bacterium]